MIPMDTIRLRNGMSIPAIGLGPMIMNYGKARGKRTLCKWNIPYRIWRKFQRQLDYSRFVQSIASGIRSGFRLIDYATAYGNLQAVGDAFLSSGLRREEIYLTGRISNRAQFKGKNAILQEVETILKAYGTDYLDLLMFHFPVPDCYINTWKVLCELYDKGVCRSAGVANCHRHHLVNLETAGIIPMYNQIEVHPLFTNSSVVEYCASRGIVVEAYTPLARMDDRLYRLPQLKTIAQHHGKTTAQVVLRWHLQKKFVPCVRALNKKHQLEALDIFDFHLSDEEMSTIDNFNIDSRLRFDPDNCDFTIL